MAPLAAFKALFSNTKADLSTAQSECCRWDLNNTAVGAEKEPLEMARQGTDQMGRWKAEELHLQELSRWRPAVALGLWNRLHFLIAFKSLSEQLRSNRSCLPKRLFFLFGIHFREYQG